MVSRESSGLVAIVSGGGQRSCFQLRSQARGSGSSGVLSLGARCAAPHRRRRPRHQVTAAVRRSPGSASHRGARLDRRRAGRPVPVWPRPDADQFTETAAPAARQGQRRRSFCHDQLGHVARADLGRTPRCGGLRFRLRVRAVDHMDDEVRLGGFLRRRPEHLDQAGPGRWRTTRPSRQNEKRGNSVTTSRTAGWRIATRVPDQDPGAGQRIEQARLARVHIAAIDHRRQ